MHTPTIMTAAVLSLGLAAATGPAFAWDLHDTLAPGPTPQSADAPPETAYQPVPDGADLRLPDVDLRFPDADGSPPVHSSRCAEAIAQSGPNSAEAWTQC